MKNIVKNQALSLGGRIGFVFLIASSLLVLTSYFVLSQSFQEMLIDYSITLVQSMVDQGVTTVEYELKSSQEEVNVRAQSFLPSNSQTLALSASDLDSGIIRISYISNSNIMSSDNKQGDIQNRQDIINAYKGQSAVYGPYFNQNKDFVICYSSPVRQNNEIIGVLTIEKDAYKFCDLIKDIRFINSGESYIIDSEGNDIAVSNLEHISWVNDQYNARRILKNKDDKETLSIAKLEEKGLSGEKGVGTYKWDDSLCYVAYAPIPSVNWVLLAGLRQEEINIMTQSVFYSSISEGPILAVGIVVFLVLTILILYWIITSLKKNAEINEKLNIMASYDALTNLLNRNSFNERVEKLLEFPDHSLGCVYIDVNGLHEINNHLGHQAGDEMLITVANEMNKLFTKNDIYRIGGDEFIIFCQDQEKQKIEDKIKILKDFLRQKHYEISAGVAWNNKGIDVNKLVYRAEEAMQKDKQRYYEVNGKERQMRELDRNFKQLITEKQDADTFLSFLSTEFKGVYFVDLGTDRIRHLYIPQYFEEILKETDEIFSKALIIYGDRFVKKEYRNGFKDFCDFKNIIEQLNKDMIIKFTYQKVDNVTVELQILKFKTYSKQCSETLWIFSNYNDGKD